MRTKEERKEYNKNYRSINREELNRKERQARRVSAAAKTYTMVGKIKIVDLPANILDVLRERFRVDETSKTGLRWAESSVNRSDCRGKEAGHLLGSRRDITRMYYVIRFNIGKVKHAIGVSRVIVMLATNAIIDPALCVNHKNRNTQDNRIANLEVTTASANCVNRTRIASSSYKNINKRSSGSFSAIFGFLGLYYRTKYTSSEHHAVILGWELMTSGEVPLGYIKSQSDEWKDGTYLQRALAECKKQGISVKRPKFKTLYEYIASVEGPCYTG
jgi:hypothetical protein